VSYFISEYIFEGSYSVRRLFSVKTKTDDESCTESSSTRTQYLQVVKNTVSTITGREGFEEEKSSVDFDNELLPRDFLKVQCKLNGSGLQYVRVRGVLLKEVMYDDKPGLMDVQKARRRYWVSRTQYAITTFIHRSAPKIAQELRYIDWVATTLYYCIRIGASQDAMVGSVRSGL
jgi:hypothetical protein